ncbi:HNH endonuclease [Streptomyces cadmiisoli]|uniref:HNH endonuclease n=1 Tax=Streptomyces cadmiisoli TaxID=2184053 RepID=UPI00365FFBF5
MAVSKRLRYEILRRDNFACRYCGAAAPDVKLNADHVIPQSLGGTDKPENLVASCTDCNSGKTSSMPNAMVVADVDQETFRRAAELRQASENQRQLISCHIYMVWMWAYEKTGHCPTQQQQQWFMEETNKVLACGYSAHVDLTEPAYRAGLQNALDIQSYIKLPEPPVSPEAVRFVNCVDALAEWETEWDHVTLTGDPKPLEVQMFIEVVGAALDAGHTRSDVINAASMAGRDMSLDIDDYLPELSGRGGAN